MKKEEVQDTVHGIVEEMLQKNRPILKAQVIQDFAEKESDIKIKLPSICNIMRKQIGLGYRMIKRVSI